MLNPIEINDMINEVQSDPSCMNTYYIDGNERQECVVPCHLIKGRFGFDWRDYVTEERAIEFAKPDPEYYPVFNVDQHMDMYTMLCLCRAAVK